MREKERKTRARLEALLLASLGLVSANSKSQERDRDVQERKQEQEKKGQEGKEDQGEIKKLEAKLSFQGCFGCFLQILR